MILETTDTMTGQTIDKPEHVYLPTIVYMAQNPDPNGVSTYIITLESNENLIVQTKS